MTGPTARGGLAAVNGIEIYYESLGSGAPLVMLGGLGLDVSEMGVLTGPLSQRFRVVAVDNRGAGRSAKPPGPYSIEQMAADVTAVLDRLGLPRAHVLGLSMGGRIAMALALACPERVDRLVLVATGPRAGQPQRPGWPCVSCPPDGSGRPPGWFPVGQAVGLSRRQDLIGAGWPDAGRDAEVP
jgi:pimeloyl-ACP methyl ester carboxylesterase